MICHIMYKNDVTRIGSIVTNTLFDTKKAAGTPSEGISAASRYIVTLHFYHQVFLIFRCVDLAGEGMFRDYTSADAFSSIPPDYLLPLLSDESRLRAWAKYSWWFS